MMERVDFARAVGQAFDVFVGEATVTMTLVSIDPLKHQSGMAREGFSLIFRSANPVVLPQKTYLMRTAALAEGRKIGIFVVPIGRDQAGVVYQAVFN